MGQQDHRQSCGSSQCGCGPQPLNIGRRDFLALTGLGAASVLLADLPAVASPFEEKDFESLVPRDKKLNPQWIDRLTKRGEPEIYRGAELNWIGMPVGGIGCGQLCQSDGQSRRLPCRLRLRIPRAQGAHGLCPPSDPSGLPCTVHRSRGLGNDFPEARRQGPASAGRCQVGPTSAEDPGV
jgi:hypothetical protein